MRYLLIDFGASYIKTVIFERETNTFSQQMYHDSPFLHSPSITKSDLRILLEKIVGQHSCDAIVACTILGGYYDGNTYHSWKSNPSTQKNYCLLSGLFTDEKTFHIHEHHRQFTSASSYESSLTTLGHINGIPLYSALGDTYCVINSVDIKEGEVGINMGTGSQVFYKQDGELKVLMYIPSGRALLMFQRFFEEFDFDMFSYIKTLSVNDIINSTLTVDMNVFTSARNFVSGGKILSIMEGSFTKKNLVASIVRNYVVQYKEFIPTNTSRIHLLGGIPNKITQLKELFEYYYPTTTISFHIADVEPTHTGISKFITGCS